jgi:hypothetical protein
MREGLNLSKNKKKIMQNSDSLHFKWLLQNATVLKQCVGNALMSDNGIFS